MTNELSDKTVLCVFWYSNSKRSFVRLGLRDMDGILLVKSNKARQHFFALIVS